MAELLTGGAPKQTLWNHEGVRLADDVVLVRSAGQPRFTLALRLAGTWYSAASVPACDPTAMSWREHMTCIGPSPAEIAVKQRQAERAAMTPEERYAEEVAQLKSLGFQVRQPGSAPIGRQQKNYPDIGPIV
jgi:hypothetical protein